MPDRRSLTWRFLAPEWIKILLATVASLVLGVVGAVLGVLLGPAIKILSQPAHATFDFSQELGSGLAVLFDFLGIPTQYSTSQVLSFIPLLLVTCGGLRACLTFAQWGLWEWAAEKACLGIRHRLVAQFLELDPARRLQSEGRTEEDALAAAASTDVRMLREYYVHFFGGVPRELVQAVWLIAALILLSPSLAAVFFVGVLPAVALIRVIGRKLKKRTAAALDDSAHLTEWLQQRLSGIETIKHYRTESFEMKRFQQYTLRLYTQFFRAARTKARTGPMLQFVTVLALVVVFWVAFHQIAATDLSGAGVLSFFACAGLLGQHGHALGRYYNAHKEGLAARDRIANRLQFFAEHRRPLSWECRGSDLWVRDVSFRYESEWVIKDFSTHIEPGQIVCIVGPSGSGKSTLLRLLLGLIKPEKGTIVYPESLQGRPPGYLPQSLDLLHGSIAENVSFPSVPPAQSSKIEDALRQVQLLSMVEQLPEGIHSAVGLSGRGLSGGQAQRLLFARLFFHKPPVLIVDEGTSALDPENEQILLSLLRQYAQEGGIVITVAHRPAIAEAADVVIDLGALPS